MDRVSEKRRRNVQTEGEDRISSLPDDLLHQILSEIDSTQVVQSSIISHRWRNLWKSAPHLNFDRGQFSKLTHFTKFVNKSLSRHNRRSGISVIDLKCQYGSIALSLVKKIAAYAVSHNARQLIISSAVSRRGVGEFSLSTFISPSLQHLHLHLCSEHLRIINSPAWNLPNLTTLVLQDISFEFCCNHDGSTESLDLFSNLPHLKNLTLEKCLTTGWKVFKIISPSLEHLTVLGHYWGPKTCDYVVTAPNLLSINFYEFSTCYIRIGIDKKKNQLDLMIRILLTFDQWLTKEGTKPYDELDAPCKEITKLWNTPPTSTLNLSPSELMQVCSSFLASLFKCDLIPV